MFAVTSKALDDFAGTLDHRAADARTAAAYATRHLTLEPLDAFDNYAAVRQAVEQAGSTLASTLQRLAELCDASAVELRASARSYLVTDDEEDRRLDATYSPGTPR